MMNSGASTSCFSTVSSSQMYPATAGDDVVSSLNGTQSSLSQEESHFSTSLLYHLSLLQDKVHQIQSIISLVISPDHHHQHHHHHLESSTTSVAMANIGTLVQEIIGAASSMIFTCQQLAIGSGGGNNNANNNGGQGGIPLSCTDENLTTRAELQNHQSHHVKVPETGFSPSVFDADRNFMRNSATLFQDTINLVQERGHVVPYSSQETQNLDFYTVNKGNNGNHKTKTTEKRETGRAKNYDIVELDAEDLLAKYTHYCHICGKGFKRDANLRMHMRAHGDEYKTAEALTNPLKRKNNSGDGDDEMSPTKFQKKYYSCPQEGCRWNQRHEKFQPLKSIICVKNHYKRSHCPKMYVCKRCHVKQFSVLSDLRTHEKHCGDVKWVCSCGTRFSRKDKLMGHVALFVGHAPVDGATAAVKQVKAEERVVYNT